MTRSAGHRRWVLLAPLFWLALASCWKSSPEPKVTTEDAPAQPIRMPGKQADDWPEFGDASAAGYVSAIPGYVDDARCAECHADLAESFQDVGMGHSFYPADTAERIEDFENNHFYHEPSDEHYEMVDRDGSLYQRRYQLDEKGNRINELEVKADFIIGSGNHVRTYVYRTPSNEMFEMPLAWYSQSGQWGMNPGYDKPDHEGFSRSITRSCMFCHNAYPEVPAGSDAAWLANYFPKSLPHGIGCQRCHGPGEAHVMAAENPDTSDEDLLASIVNPSKLTPERRDDVCYQCHLQPSSQFVSQQTRFGRGEYSYRPGEPLADYRVNIDFPEPAGHERFEINHHPYRMVQSRCYLESDGAMSCLTCHDPHRKPTGRAAIAQFRQACLSCHELSACETAETHEREAMAAGVPHEEALADCASCHMPQRRTDDVIRAVMTDHKIVARPEPEAERLAMKTEPPAMLREGAYPYGDDYDPNDPEIVLALAMTEAAAGDNQKVEALANLILRSRTSALEPYAELVTLLEERDHSSSALPVLSHLLGIHGEHPHVQLETGIVLSRLGATQQAQEHYVRALELGRPVPEAYLGLANGRLPESPTAPNAAQQLREAEAMYREAIRLRPTYGEAHLNLGIMLHALGRYPEAEQELRRALALDPSFHEAHDYLESISQSH